MDLVLAKTTTPEGTTLTFIEPSADLAEQLEERFEKSFPKDRLKIINSDLQTFATDEHFNLILMSHLFYHVPRAVWSEQLTKVLSLLKPNGELIIVLREKDDVYDFKMAFKPLLFDESFKALTIDDVLTAMPSDTQVEIARYSAASELNLPFHDKLDDVISIVEFLLNKPWNTIPASIQQDALNSIKDKGGIFKLCDGIAVIKKT